MNVIEKRDFIHSHLHKIKETAIDDIYSKLVSLLDDALMEESELDIENGRIISHELLKQEVQSWRQSK